MSGTLPPPFPKAIEVDTEPGLGLLALKAENARLRRERNEAREQLAAKPSTPPPRTVGQKTLGALARGSKYAGLFTAGALGLRLASKQWPQYAEFIEGILGALGL